MFPLLSPVVVSSAVGVYDRRMTYFNTNNSSTPRISDGARMYDVYLDSKTGDGFPVRLVSANGTVYAGILENISDASTSLKRHTKKAGTKSTPDYMRSRGSRKLAKLSVRNGVLSLS